MRWLPRLSVAVFGLAGCSIAHEPVVTGSNPLTYAGQTYYVCADKISQVQNFEQQGLHKQQPKTREQLKSYETYAIAKDQLYLDPQCHKKPADGGFTWGGTKQVEGSANFFKALAATTPPEYQQHGKAAEDVFVKAAAYGVPADEMERLKKSGAISELIELRKVHAAAKAELDKNFKLF